MSGSEVTARDRIWAAIITQDGRFQVSNIREAINSNDRPSNETIRRVLRSGAKLGVIDHQSNSSYYCIAAPPMGGVSTLDRLLGFLEEWDRASISDPEVREEHKRVRRKRTEESLRMLHMRHEGYDPLPNVLDPDGIETEAFIDQFPAERMEDVRWTESDEEIVLEVTDDLELRRPALFPDDTETDTM